MGTGSAGANVPQLAPYIDITGALPMSLGSGVNTDASVSVLGYQQQQQQQAFLPPHQPGACSNGCLLCACPSFSLPKRDACLRMLVVWHLSGLSCGRLCPFVLPFLFTSARPLLLRPLRC